MPISVRTVSGDRFSCYRTTHSIRYYCEVHTVEEIGEAFQFAAQNGLSVYALGNGSNTFLERKTIRTFIIRNALPAEIVELDDGVLDVSSSVQISDLLQYLYRNGLDGPYYLSALPASLGGVLAMNAGRGKGHDRQISDYVQEVAFFYRGEIHRWTPQQYCAGYRHTAFLEMDNVFILSATMSFGHCQHEGNPILDRRIWVREYQDLTGPNCGSVFTEYSGTLLRYYSRLTRFLPASFSHTTPNWVINRAANPIYLRTLINACILLHRLLRKRIRLELRRVS
ncbi:MAG: FAD-binding protein [Anaerolineae bacterium]|jgi:UDP-N-acetylmuramate dehydrogenase